MALFETFKTQAGKKVWNFFVVQSTPELWMRLLSTVVIIDILGIVISLIFFLRIKDMNQPIIPLMEVAKQEEVDRSSVRTTLETFSHRALEFAYRKANGVSIPEPR